MPIFQGAWPRERHTRYGDEPVPTATPTSPTSAVGASARSSSPWRASGEPRGGLRSSGSGRAGAVGRLRPLCRRPPVQRDRRAGHRDGANLAIHDESGKEIFAPGFSMGRSSRSASTHRWCGSATRRWGPTASMTSRPASSPCRPSPSPRSSSSPPASGRSSASTSSTRRWSLMPRWVDAKNLRYGLGEEMISILRTLNTLGLDRTDPVAVKGVSVAARCRRGLSARPGDDRTPG